MMQDKDNIDNSDIIPLEEYEEPILDSHSPRDANIIQPQLIL